MINAGRRSKDALHGDGQGVQGWGRRAIDALLFNLAAGTGQVFACRACRSLSRYFPGGCFPRHQRPRLSHSPTIDNLGRVLFVFFVPSLNQLLAYTDEQGRAFDRNTYFHSEFEP